MNEWSIKYERIVYSKDGKIYLPNCPSKWLSKPKVSKVIMVLMTCGGGMGGCRWKEYLIDKDIKDGLNQYTRIDGLKIKLNSKYVVKVVYGMYIVKSSYIHYNENYKETIGKELPFYALSNTKDIEVIHECKTMQEVNKF